MGKRTDIEKREEIRERASGQSVRSLAKDLQVAPGTILKWKHREDLNDRPRNPKGPPGLSEFGKAVFREMVRLTGYYRSRLFEYLEPVWGELPSQARENPDDLQSWTFEPLTGKICPKILHPRTFHRAMKECGLDDFQLAQPDNPGTLAIHKVQINWKYKSGSAADGELLLLLERNSGALYAEAISGKTRPVDVARALKRFGWMLAIEPFQIHRVTPKSGAPINLGEVTVPVVDDPPSPPQANRVELPGAFASKHDLNRTIKDVLDRINLTDRAYYHRNTKWEMTPYKRFVRMFPLQVINAGTERRLKKRMRLSKKI